MYKLIVMYLLVIHLIGDYYLQSEGLAQRKKEGLHMVLLHGLLYGLVGLVFTIPLLSLQVLALVMAMAVLHLCVDLVKYYIQGFLVKKRKNTHDALVYSLDQGLHLFTILGLAGAYCYQGYGFQSFIPGAYSLESILTFVAMMLLVSKPVNVTFRIFFAHVKPEKSQTRVGETYKVGQWIGSMERIMVALLLSVNQYAAIGLVFTAKSISRYNKISEDQAFAEYYLLGTLFSMLATVVIYLSLYHL